MTKARFEDIANNDININQERRTVIKIDKMDFVNKNQEYWREKNHHFSDPFLIIWDNQWNLP